MHALYFHPLIDKVTLLQQNGSEDLAPSSRKHSSDAHNWWSCVWNILRKVCLQTWQYITWNWLLLRVLLVRLDGITGTGPFMCSNPKPLKGLFFFFAAAYSERSALLTWNKNSLLETEILKVVRVNVIPFKLNTSSFWMF